MPLQPAETDNVGDYELTYKDGISERNSANLNAAFTNYKSVGWICMFTLPLITHLFSQT
jgi:hypothetical protein